jgi:hypothetical protein
MPSGRIVALLGAASAACLVAGVAGAVDLRHSGDPVQVAVRSGGGVLPGEDVGTAEPPVDLTVPSVTIPSVPVTVPTLPVPLPSLRTPTAPPSSTITTVRVPSASRPSCPGEPWGYGGFGCSVKRNEAGVSIELSEYGQVLQVGRDRTQLFLKVDQGERAYKSVRFDHGNGESQSYEGGCPPQMPGGATHFFTYQATGDYSITAHITVGRCNQSTWSDEQTVSVTIPVRVCTKVENINGDVRCTVP